MSKAFAVMTLLFPGGTSRADQVFATSYDMPNGQSSHPGSSIQYYDAAYTGSGDKTTDLAPLWGGSGELTDGVLPTHADPLVPTVPEWGPYVAWLSYDPTIVFHFGQAVNLDRATLHVYDWDGRAGIFTPAAVTLTMGGTTLQRTFADPAGSGLRTLVADNLSLSGDRLDMTITRNSAGVAWTFLSEVTFDGALAPPPVPEPAAGLLFALGAVVLAARRRRR